MVSVALRPPAAYRSWTGSGRGGGKVGGTGKGGVRGRDESGRKIVVVITTEC